MKLNGIKKIGFLAVLMLIAFSAFAWAVCPPGSVQVADPDTLYGTVLAAGRTYCVLGSGAAENKAIAVDNVTIEGLTPNIVFQSVTANQTGSFIVTGNNVTIKNLTIDGGVAAGPHDVGIDIAGGSGCTVQNVNFIDSGTGNAFGTAAILVQASNDNILGNTIATDGHGISVTGGNSVTIQNNTISLNRAAAISGIRVVAGTGHVVRNNTVTTGVATGADLIDNTVTGTLIQGNTVTSTAGFNLGDGIGTTGANTVMRQNTVTFTGAGGVPNAFQSAGANTVIEDCHAIMNATGNDAFNITGANNVIRSCTALTPGADGVAFDANSSNGLVEGCTFTRCGSDGIELNTGNHTIGNASVVINSPVANGIHFLAAAATNCTIQHFEINGAGVDGIAFNQAATNNIIHTGTIQGSAGDGIDFIIANANNNIIGGDGAKQVVVRNCGGNGIVTNAAVLNNQFKNVLAEGNRGIGINIIGGATNTTVDGCTVRNNGSGNFGENIVVAGASNNSTVKNCTVTSNIAVTLENRGMRVSGSNNILLQNNTVENTSGTLDIGIFLDTGAISVTVNGNTIRNMLNIGIRNLGGSTTLGVNTIIGNTLEGNVTGVSFGGGAATMGTCNTIKMGATGVFVESGANAGNFQVSQTDVLSPIRARNSGLGTLNAENCWWGNSAGPPAGTIFGNVDYTPFATSPFHGDVPPVTGPTHTYGAAAGWYMASVPLNSGTPSALFGTIAYHWNCATGVYDLASMIEPKFGYWVSLPANKSVTDSGSQVTSDVTLAISCTGWHQVSAPWSYPKSAIKVTKGGVEKSWADAVTAGWVRDDIYAYSATGTDYTMPSTLNPWYGYWVRANVSGLSLKLLYASGTPVSAGFAPMGPKALVVPADLPPMPPSPSVGADDLEFGNYPNPVTDVYTTTFAVKGAMAYLVESLKVQIFDLAGRLVYEAEEAGTSLDWHTDSDYGEYLANGVYLYKLYALVNGEWVVSEVKKLAILR